MRAPAGIQRVTDVLRRADERVGLRAQRRDGADLDSLAEAVAENARLAVLLERQVAALETSLVPLLEAADSPGRDDADD